MDQKNELFIRIIKGSLQAKPKVVGSNLVLRMQEY